MNKKRKDEWVLKKDRMGRKEGQDGKGKEGIREEK